MENIQFNETYCKSMRQMLKLGIKNKSEVLTGNFWCKTHQLHWNRRKPKMIRVVLDKEAM